MIRKLKAGKYIVTVEFIEIPGTNRYYIKFPYNKKLIDEIKVLEGAKWHGYDEKPKKLWSIPLTPRNKFQLNFLDVNCSNPYIMYDLPLVDFSTTRPLYTHQIEMCRFALTRHYCIFACEMGTGKTLSAIEVIEHAKKDGILDNQILYVGPKSGVKAVGRELVKWNAKFDLRLITYEGLVKEIKFWSNSDIIPRIVIFDECSKLKTPTAQRSKAALELANMVREFWKEKGYVILMSGTPAPKSPVDWWHQAEVACPGFLREGNIHKFKARLCIIEERESLAGGRFPHIVTWMDDEHKCAICGQLKEHNNHQLFITKEAGEFLGETKMTQALQRIEKPLSEEQLKSLAQDHNEIQNLQYINSNYHPFKASRNEIKYLYERLKGLVLVKFKQDCLDLPDKQYEIIKVKPSPEILRAAKIIKTKSTRTITALTLLRELSDGFQYEFNEDGKETCPVCHGSGITKIKIPKSLVNTQAPLDIKVEDFTEETITCELCGGDKVIPHMSRVANVLNESPKDSAFIELLDDHEDVGRFVVWGGFTGTIDRLVNICHQYSWATLRVDGRGYFGTSSTGETLDSDELLDAMDNSHPRRQELLDKYPQLCFVGHPEAGGMALTLTASPTALYYSNSFKGESRMQSEDRIHRMGMDKNRGARIIDLIHLSTDQLILDNLKQKRKLQNLSMGELSEALEKEERVI